MFRCNLRNRYWRCCFPGYCILFRLLAMLLHNSTAGANPRPERGAAVNLRRAKLIFEIESDLSNYLNSSGLAPAAIGRHCLGFRTLYIPPMKVARASNDFVAFLARSFTSFRFNDSAPALQPRLLWGQRKNDLESRRRAKISTSIKLNIMESMFEKRLLEPASKI